jgi:deoxyribonuclease V
MKLPPARHRWTLSPKRAVALQQRLAVEVIESPLGEVPRLIAGGDCAFADAGRTIIAGWVVWDRIDERTVEVAIARRPVRFPYVPGLLSFREAPALLAAARRLRTDPALFMIDGQGRAHPRRFGLACHVGLLMGRPTIGCGKSRLCGEHGEVGRQRGSSAALHDHGIEIGKVVRVIDGTKPLYVSVGYMVTIEDSIRVLLDCVRRFRHPEPVRLADKLVRDAKTKPLGESFDPPKRPDPADEAHGKN